jgi:hypothetical protein
MTRGEHTVLNRLQVGKNLIMLPSDDCNAMMVITTQQYCSKIKLLLLSDLIYKPHRGDRPQKVEQQTTWLIQRPTLDEELKNVLQPQGVPLDRTAFPRFTIKQCL